MKRPLTALIILLLLVPALAAVATGGYGDYPPNDPCDEYHESRHPECQTTTTYPSTTQQETTTTTEQTTTTQPEVTTTSFTQQTTTTVQECAEGLIHEPPFCVDPSTTAPPEVPSTVATTPAGEESLPFTGLSTSDMGLLGLAVAGAGVLLLGLSRRTA